MGELQDVCCALGLWYHLVSDVGKNGRALRTKSTYFSLRRVELLEWMSRCELLQYGLLHSVTS
jgi:hypothetical protein